MTQIRIYDSLRREKVPFEPIEPGKASVYLCGPTTYDSAHIGHAYSALCFDVIRRSLVWLGYETKFVRNITDVDDKIIARANENGEPPLELAARYADEYNEDMERFGVMPPDVEPRVSTHIDNIIALVARLIDNDKAYEIDGDVYYSVQSFADYGKLSGQSVADLRSGSRVEVDGRKKSPVDFALWKSAKPGEPSWESPWGNGRPGWHIECSAMTTAHLGETFDLHAGGKDLIFPHHENEIAQSQGAYGPGTFAQIWMHNGFLNFSGEKMSRSIGNVFGCKQIADAAGPEAMRLFTVSHHYRSPVGFEWEERGDRVVFPDLEAADRRLDYFYTTLKRLDALTATMKPATDGELIAGAEEIIPSIRGALSDDFNTSIVMAILGDAAKLANKLIDEPKGVPKDVRRRSLDALGASLREGANAIGLLLRDPVEYLRERRARLASRRGIDEANVDGLIKQRTEARANKEWARADELRDELQAMGVEILDTPGGAEWRVID